MLMFNRIINKYIKKGNYKNIFDEHLSKRVLKFGTRRYVLICMFNDVKLGVKAVHTKSNNVRDN